MKLFYCDRYHCWLSIKACDAYSWRNPDACRKCKMKSNKESGNIYGRWAFVRDIKNFNEEGA